MIRLLQFLCSGCWHVWETQDVVTLNKTDEWGQSSKGSRVKLKCTKCGNWKKKDLIG